MPSTVSTIIQPEIKLDTTIAELYRQGSPSNAHKRIAQVLCGVSALIPLTAYIPRNLKFLYHDGVFNEVPTIENSFRTKEQLAEAQRQLAVKYLSLIGQRDAFLSGDTDVILFYTDTSPEAMKSDEEQTYHTISLLPKEQQPNIIFCLGPAHIPTKEAGIDLIAYKVAFDGLQKYNLVFPLEAHWLLNTKGALATSGLPTPQCKLISIEGHGQDSLSCCDTCLAVPPGLSVSPECTGSRNEWLTKQCDAVYESLSAHPLPFIMKNQQTLGGGGTYFVRTEEARQRLITDLRAGLLRRQLSAITKSNVHLGPGTILLSEIIEEPIADYGITFFVTDQGMDPIYLAVTEQTTTVKGAWIGSTIDYPQQDALKVKFWPLIVKITRWLQDYGYVGPVGADVLETAAPSTSDNEGNDTATTGHPDSYDDAMSRLFITDLNVRTAGSLCLPLLRGHFVKRQLLFASSFSLSAQSSRESFSLMFSHEIEVGGMVIISWYEDHTTGVSWADVVVGGVDREELNKIILRVKEAADEVTW